MPIGAEILHVDSQDGELCLWALVDTNPGTPVTRVISVVDTGRRLWPEREGRRNDYIGSVVISPSVWHVFELL